MKRFLSVLFILLFVAGSTIPSSAAFIIHPNDATEPGKTDPTSISFATHEFMHLSRKEMRARFKEAKSEIKNFKAEKKAGNEPSTNQLLLVILAILLPPLAVYLHEGVINGKFWLDLVLTLLFFIPGVVYALIVVLGKS
ncbi:MAG: YqaE/Pmp3 family membrane protein [Ginsengibacter sp.]